MPRLHHFTLDPFSRRMRLALAEYGVGGRLCATRSRGRPEPDLYRLNPAGTLPVFVEDDGSAVSGIEALSEYLEETRNEPGLAHPRRRAERAPKCAAWSAGSTSKFYAEVVRAGADREGHPPLHAARAWAAARPT